jgi:hypothetical protein
VLSVVGPEYLFLFAMEVSDRCRSPLFQKKKKTHKPGMIKASVSIKVITASN